MNSKKTLATCFALAALVAASASSFGAVTPYSWLRLGEGGSWFADSSGQNHAFNAAFSTGNGGDLGAVIVPTAVGGPLGGPTGPTSALSTRFGYYQRPNSGMWVQGPNNSVPPASQWQLPATNWVVEAWVLPVEGRQTSEILNTGTGQFGGTPGGIAFRTRIDPDTGDTKVRLDSIGPDSANRFQIGDEATLPMTRFTHIAAVNNAGTVTFYVNGVQVGASASANTTAPSGVPYVGSGQDTGNPFWGFMDEVRYSTFAPGAFQVSDLLLLPPGAGIIQQPQSASVWEGAPAIFNVLTPVDDRTTFQWKVGGQNIAGATSAEYIIPSVATADNGKVYTVTLSNSGIDKTSDPATLTVKPVETANNNFFRESISGEASLLAYFPIDLDTGATISNVKDASHNGTIDGNVDFDGRTTRAYGVKSLRFQSAGSVSIPSNTAYEFADGTGTVEALVYLASGALTPAPQNIVSVAAGDGQSVWQLQVSQDGNSLIYRSDVASGGVTWVVTPSLLNRFAHVALVFNGGNITAYVDGNPLGTKPNPGLGASAGVGANIGSAGRDGEGNLIGAFNGNIDEVAIYGDALSDNAIAIHNSRFVYGTAVTAPAITTAPTGTFNVLAGGAPQFRVTATGTAPLTYQWKRNGQPVLNNPTATTAAFTILNSTVDSSGTYTVTVTNPQGSATSDPFTVNFAPAPVGDNYAAKVLANNPSAYYRLSETSGPTLVDSAGGLNGTFGPGVEFGKAGAPGTSGTAVRIPTSGITSVPYTPTLNPAGPYTIEFWAQPEQSGSIQGAVVGTQNRATGRAGYAVYQGFNVNGWEAHLGFGESVIFLQGTTPPEAGRWDHVVVTWDGVNASKLYVNGVVEATSDQSPTRPNLAQPFEIGSRFNGSAHWHGIVDEVAFYNKALTEQDVTNHFSVAWIPAQITASPANATATEAGTITLTGAATGYPNKYQWYKNGQPIEAATNPDNSQHYTGITSPSLTINQITEADAGQYYLVVQNPLGDQQTTAATVTFARDTVAPAVKYVSADASLKRVRVVFSKPVTPETALVPSNYVFTGGLVAASVASSVFDPAIVDVVLQNPMTAGTTYSLTVKNVADTRANANVIGANSNIFTGYVETPGGLAVDLYRGLDGTAINFVDPPIEPYPNGVYTNFTITSFATPDLGIDQYAAHYYGWVTPPEDGDYTFFLRSDDNSQLYLSTDATPEKAELIAYENGCCNGFLEPNPDNPPTQTSTPRTLLHTQKYFVEAFLKEGGGGDFLQVAWRKGTTPAAGTLQPIPGSALSSFAPVPQPQLAATLNASGQVTITWTGTGTLQESTNLTDWSNVPGNPSSGYVVTPTGGDKKFYRVVR